MLTAREKNLLDKIIKFYKSNEFEKSNPEYWDYKDTTWCDDIHKIKEDIEDVGASWEEACNIVSEKRDEIWNALNTTFQKISDRKSQIARNETARVAESMKKFYANGGNKYVDIRNAHIVDGSVVYQHKIICEAVVETSFPNFVYPKEYSREIPETTETKMADFSFCYFYKIDFKKININGSNFQGCRFDGCVNFRPDRTNNIKGIMYDPHGNDLEKKRFVDHISNLS